MQTNGNHIYRLNNRKNTIIRCNIFVINKSTVHAVIVLICVIHFSHFSYYKCKLSFYHFLQYLDDCNDVCNITMYIYINHILPKDETVRFVKYVAA